MKNRHETARPVSPGPSHISHEAWLDQTQRLSRTGSWALNLETGHLVWSAETYRIFEIEAEGSVNTYAAFLGAVHPDDREKVDKAYNGAVASGELYEVTHRVITPGGRIKWVLERGETHYDDNGRPVRTLGSVQDITALREAQEALRLNHQIVNAVFDTTSALIAYLDTNMNFVRVNAAYAAADGRSTDYFVGKNHFALFPHAENEAIFRRVVETGVPHTANAKPFEYEHNPERGVSHWDWTLTPIRDGRGIVTGLVLSLTDVSARVQALEAAQRAEQALRLANESLEARIHDRTRELAEREQLLQLAQRIAKIGHWQANLQTGALEWSDEIYRIFGRERARFAPSIENFYACVYADDMPALKASEKRAFETDGRHSVDHRIVRPDGEIRWVHEEAHLMRDARGEPCLLTGTVQDITDRKQAEIAFGLQSRRNELILSTTLDGFFAADQQGRVRLANPAFCAMLGYTQDELLQCSIPDFEASENAADVAAHIARVIETGRDRFDSRHRRKDGTVIDVEVSVNLVELGGEKLFYAFVRDISQRLRAESALRQARDVAESANRAKSEFLSRMSHELRTPMNAILGFSQVLEHETLAPEQLEYVQEIHRAGDHLLELINELLDLSRIETGKLMVVVSPISIGAVVERSLHMVTPLFATHGIRFLNKCDPALTLLADSTRLRQVLVNLLSNAAKYNRQDGTVTLDCVTQPDGTVRLRVTDTGPGIAPDQIQKLFRPFERLGAEFTAVEGTGIGLALSHQLMELMGGRIGVDSELGRGATFWVELPAAAEVVHQAAVSQPVETTATSDGSYSRILYVEDNPANLRVVEALFRHQPGLRLLSATNGEFGLELAREYRPDAILLDIHLPGMDGYAVLDALKQDARTRDIPVIALSADAMPIDIEKGLRAGFVKYLTKPVRVTELMEALTAARLAAGQSLPAV